MLTAVCLGSGTECSIGTRPSHLNGNFPLGRGQTRGLAHSRAHESKLLKCPLRRVFHLLFV
jgi:hypothetical protein